MNLPPPIRLLLWPFSLVYGVAARLTPWLYACGIYPAKHLNAPVVSVGNLTVGGTGKTPMVLWLAEKFLADGKHVAILSRGYRGSGGSSDEVEVLKMHLGDRVRFGVGPDRYLEGKRLESEHRVDVFLLDDGFQHLQLARTVDIVLVDSKHPLHKEFLLPAGRLREPRSAMSRASVAVFTRVDQLPFDTPFVHKFPKLPIFTASTKLLGFRRVGEADEAGLSEKLENSALAFCGIGNPEAFFADLARWGVAISRKVAFRDHHVYSAHDVKKIAALAQHAQAKALVTTEKDLQNLGSAKFSLPLYCCEIALEIPDAARFWQTVTGLLPANAEVS